jgi:hypothetical protein
MVWAEDHKAKPAVIPARKPPVRIPSSVVPWLTTRCLVAAVALQVLGILLRGKLGGVPGVLGIVLAVVGLGALAAVKGRSRAWAMLAVLPVVGPVIGYVVLRFRAPAPDVTADAPVSAVRSAAHIILFGALLWASGVWLYEGQKREIRGDAPDGFPILAVVRTGGGAAFSAFVVQQRDFAKFVRNYPEFSYLVPPGTEKFLSEELRYYNISGEFKDMDINPPGYFKMTRLGADRQRFEVRYPIHIEAHITGWYEATAQSIEPRRYRVYHDFASGIIWMFAFSIAVGIYFPLAWLLNRYLWSRWRQQPAGSQ